jgi:citrate synthase
MQSSAGIGANADIFHNIIDRYITQQTTLIICADHNVYSESDPHYHIAQEYVNIPVAEYIDIIKNADWIYVIDSCFSVIVLPLINMCRIKPQECLIYHRDDGHLIGWT